MSSLAQQWIKKLFRRAGLETPNEDEIYNVVINLKKVSILCSCHNLNPWNLFESLYQDIEEARADISAERTLPIEALVYCIQSCNFSVLWGLDYLENNCETSAQEEQSLVLQRNLFKYMTTCTELVRSNTSIQVQEAVRHRFAFVEA